MSMVDNRVVRMTFDNTNFDKRVKDTISTLNDFEKKLSFKGATSGMNEIKNAADRLNLSQLSKKASTETDKIIASSEEAAKGISKINASANDVDLSGLGKKASSVSTEVVDSLSEANKSINAIGDSADSVDLSGLGKNASNISSEVSGAMNDASKSVYSLSDSVDSVNFSSIGDAASDAVSDVNQAFGGIDISHIQNFSAEGGQQFGVFETVATGALLGIGNGIKELAFNGLNTLKHNLLDPMIDGFKEYETQIGSIQTIIANTGRSFDSDDDIQDVNDKLDELNKYADETIYNFTEMTKAIGTFTSAGLTLDEATNAVKGAANVAALAGSGGSELTRVLPQLAQALSAGSVSLQDWMSIQTAHMDSRLFVEAIGDMAVHMAEAGKAEQSAFEAGSKLAEGYNMRSLLNKVDNKDIAGWFSSDILAETLQLFTYDLDNMEAGEAAAVKDHLKELGYTTEEEITRIKELAEMATRAAQEVRTWSQLKDTLAEGIGSNWAGIWRNFIGDFKQATDTFTFLSNSLGGAVDALFGGLTHTMQIFSRFEDTEGILGKKGGVYRLIEAFWGSYDRDEDGSKKFVDGELVRIKGAFDYLIEAISKPLGAIKDAFDSVFGMDDYQVFDLLTSLVLAFKDFTQSLIISDNAATGLRQVFEGLFSIIDIGIQAFLDLGAVVGDVIGFIRNFTDPLIDIALALGGQVGKVLLWFHDRLLDVRGVLIEASKPIRDLISIIGGLIRSFFGFVDVPDKIQSVGDVLITILDILWDIIDIPGQIKFLGDILGSIFKVIGDITGWNKAVEETNRIFEQTGKEVSVFDYWIKELLKNPIIAFFVDLGKAIVNGIGSLGKFAEPLSELGTAIWNLFSRTFNFISKLNPFEGIAQWLSSFDNGIFKFISKLNPFEGIKQWLSSFDNNIFGGFFNNIFDNLLNGINLNGLYPNIDIIDFLISKIQDLTNFLNNLSFSGFVETMQSIGTNISNTFSGLIDYISNLSIDKILSDVAKGFSKIKNKASKLPSTFKKIVPPLDDLIAAMSNNNIGGNSPFLKFIGSIIKTIGGVLSILKKVGDGFVEFGKKVYESLKNNETFMTLFNSLKDAIGKFSESAVSSINEFVKTLSSITPEDVLKALQSVGDGIGNIVKTVIDNISKIYDKVKNFITGLGLENNKFVKMITDLVDKVKQFVTDIASGKVDLISVLSDLVDWVKNNILGLGDILSDGLSNIPSIISNIPAMIADAYSNVQIPDLNFDIVGNLQRLPDAIKNLKSIPDTLKSILEGISKPFQDASKTITSVDFGKDIKGVFDGATKAVQDNSAILGTVLSVSIVYEINKFLKSLSSLAGSFGKVADAIASIPKTIENSVVGFAKAWNEWRKETPAEAMIKIAGALLLLAGALWVIASIPPDDLTRAGIAMGIMAAGLTAIITAFSLLTKYKIIDASALAGLSSAAIGLGVGILAMAGALWILSQLDPATLDKSMETLGRISILLSGLVILVSKLGGGDLQKAGIGLILIAAGLAVMVKVIDIWSKIPWPYLLENLAKMGVALLVFAGYCRLAGPDAAKAGVGLIAAAVGITILVGAMALLSALVKDMPPEQMMKTGVAMAALAIFIIALGAALRVAGPDAHKAGLGLMLLGVGVGIISVAMGVLSNAIVGKEKQFVSAAVAIGLLVAEFAVIADTVKPKKLKKASEAILMYSISLGIVAIALGGLTVAIVGKEDQFYSATFALAGLIGEFGIIAGMVDPKRLQAAAKSVIIFSAAVMIIAIALGALAQIDSVAVALSAASIDAVLAALFVIAKFTGDTDLIKTSTGIVIFAAAVLIITVALAALAQVDSIAVMNSAIAIDAVLAGLFVIAKFTGSTDMIKTATGIVIFSAAILIIAAALAALAQVDSEAVLKSAVAIDAVLAGIALVANFSSGTDMIKTSAGIVIFAAGILILSFALIQLSQVDPDKLMAASIAIGAILGVFGILVGILSIPVLAEGAAIVLPMLALAFIALGAASVLIAEALNIAVDAISKLALTGPILTTFAEIISSHLAEFAKAAVALAALGVALIPLGAGLLVFGAGALVAGAGLIVLSTGIREFLVLVADLPELLKNATGEVGDFLYHLPERIDEVWNNITTWFTETVIPAVGPVIESIISKIGEFFSKLGEWWTNTAAPFLLGLIEQFGTWWNETALPAIMSFIDQFGTWWNETALPAIISFFEMIGSKIGEFLAWFSEWFVNEGIPKIQETAGKLWEWLTNTAIPKIGEFIGMLMGKMGELASKFAEWFMNEGLPALIDAGGKVAHWFVTEAIPKIGDFIAMIFAKLGELLVDFGRWVASEGVPAAGQGLSDIMSKVGELGPMLLDWSRGIPGYIMDGIGQVWDLLSDAGANIVQGIISGVGDGVGALGDALVNVARGGLDAFLGFFGINSPSRLMRYDVAPNIVTGATKGVDDNSKSFSDSMKDLGENGISGFGDGIESGIPSIGDAVDNMTDNIMTKLRSMDGMTELFGQSLRDGVYDGINSTQGTNVTQFGNNLRAMIDGTKEALGIYSSNSSRVTNEEIGQPLSNGIAEGINSEQEGNVELLRSNLQSMVDSAKENLEIHSPSQITDEEIGQPIGEGIAKGILTTKPDISNAMNDVTSLDNLQNNSGGGTPGRIYAKLSDKSFMERVMATHVINTIAYNNKKKLPAATEEEKKKIRDETIAAGKFLTSGVFQGMDEEQKNKVSDLQKHGMALVNELKQALGIHSPSQVTRDEIGQPIGEGIADGILSTGPDISNALEEVASANSLKSAAFKGDNSSTNTAPSIVKSGTKVYAELSKQKLDERTGVLFSMLRSLYDKKKKIPTATESEKKTMAKAANELGKYVTDGYIEGMNNEQKNMTSRIRENVLKILDEFKDALGIHSPSTVIRDQVGRYIPEGLAEGVRLYSNYAYKEVDSLSNDIVGKLSDGVSNISPVASLNSKWKDNLDLSLNNLDYGNNTAQLIDFEFNYRSLENMLNSQTSAISTSIDNINSRLDTMENKTNDIISAIKEGHNLYLDSGTLVGAIAPQMDDALGKRQIYAQRGMI